MVAFARAQVVSVNQCVNASTHSCLCKPKEAPAMRVGKGWKGAGTGAGVRLLETVSETDSNSC